MQALSTLLALAAAAGGANASTSAGPGTATPKDELRAAVSASSAAEDVRARTRLVVRSLGLKLRGEVEQAPSGDPLRARVESIARHTEARVSEMIVADGTIVARSERRRWRRVTDTSPFFTYDEALELVQNARYPVRVSRRHFRAGLSWGRADAPEPLNLLGEGGPYVAKLDVRLDRRSRIKRFELRVRPADSRQMRLRTVLRTHSFDQGLRVELPEEEARRA